MSHEIRGQNYVVPGSGGLIVADSWCNTQSKKINFNYTWTINNFSFYGGDAGEVLKSSCFSARTNEKIVWCLEMYPRVECDVSEIRAKIEFSILNDKGEKTNVLYLDEAEKFSEGESWGSQIFVERYILQKENTTLLPDDKLTIFCEIYAICETINTNGFSMSTKIEMPSSTIVDDIGNILDSGQFFDCIVKVGEYDMKVHKNILSSRSSVFSAMFSNDLLESHSNILEIKDFRIEVVNEMLNYIYKDNAPNLKEMAIEILAIADKYNLGGLKVMAEQSLCDSLTIDNVCEYFRISEMYSAEGLEKNCLEFICNNAPDVVKTSSWSVFVHNHPKLVGELYRDLIQSSRRPVINDSPIRKKLKISGSAQ